MQDPETCSFNERLGEDEMMASLGWGGDTSQTHIIVTSAAWRETKWPYKLTVNEPISKRHLLWKITLPAESLLFHLQVI